MGEGHISLSSPSLPQGAQETALFSILNKLFIQEEQLKKVIMKKWITKTNKHNLLQVQRQDGPAATGTASPRLNV